MTQFARSRFSHRHLFALSTFLVPLAILAVLGWNELQRSGASAQAALAGEGREFVRRAKQAVQQRLDQIVPRLLEESAARIVQHGPLRATQQLRGEPDFATLRAILLLNTQDRVTWPDLPLHALYLALLHPAERGPSDRLELVELLLAHGKHERAIEVLRELLAKLAAAYTRDERGNQSSNHPVALEAQARIRLASALHRVGQVEQARAEYAAVIALPAGGTWRTDLYHLRLTAEAELARLSGPEERLRMLRSITDNHYWAINDGELGAWVERLAATFASDAPERAVVDGLLDLETCRVAVRDCADHYESAVKSLVMSRRRSHATGDGGLDDEGTDERLVSTMPGTGPVLVCIRPATPAENNDERWGRCASVALVLDLGALLAPTWQQIASPESRFVLAVHDPEDGAIVPPPRLAEVPADFVPPIETTHELTLTAYPADPARLVADAEASALKRTLLILALFVTALGGALWSWRSVSREAELAAMKVDLVSRVSHELKTPLALVRMYGETLSMGRARDPAQAAEFGSIIAREAERLTALIQRILDFSRQQAGTLTYAPAPLDLGELLRGVVENYSPHLQARGAFLVDSLPLGIAVHCDPNACESAIVNLVENAAKYGREGDQEHEIELVLERHGDQAVVEVRDHGRGIPPEEITRVFDGFYRASNSGEVRGAGLGLSLVRHFARAHGGDIQALAREGGGTVMRLTLPLALSTPAAAASEPAPHPTGPQPASDP